MPVLSNALHEHFAQNLARGMNGTAAAKEAGYASGPAHVTANKLMKRDDVNARVAELRAAADRQIKREVAVDRAWVVRKLVANIEAAEAAQDLGNVNRGLELVGKELGMFVNRNMDVTNPLADLPTEKLQTLLAVIDMHQQTTSRLN